MTTPDSHAQIQFYQQDPAELKAWIKAQALELGFTDCVIAKPDAQAELARLQEYLDRGYHGDMKFLEDNLEKRANPLYWFPAHAALSVYAWIIWLINRNPGIFLMLELRYYCPLCPWQGS